MTDNDIQKTKALMGALLRMPPKPHSEMKLRKPAPKETKASAKRGDRAVSAKPKNV
jgi:hypothetical protein